MLTACAIHTQENLNFKIKRPYSSAVETAYVSVLIGKKIHFKY